MVAQGHSIGVAYRQSAGRAMLNALKDMSSELKS